MAPPHDCQPHPTRATMVIKTESCSYSEYRIYPGHGHRAVSRDGTVSIFINTKVHSMAKQRIKPVKLMWTTARRRFMKKGASDSAKKNRRKRAAKIQKAVVGLTTDDLRAKMQNKASLRKQTKEENEKTAKDAQEARGQAQGRRRRPPAEGRQDPAEEQVPAAGSLSPT